MSADDDRAGGLARLRAAALQGDRLAWLLCLTFTAYAASMLASLDYNFDEGVYIQQALLGLEGQRPYVDFFYHQTPLYPFTLRLVAAIAPDSLFAYRLPSLIATALCGMLVYRIGLAWLSKPAAVAGALLFYSAPLQFFGLVALPNALMSLLATAGLYVAFFRDRSPRGSALVGGGLIGASVLFKPLSLPIAIAAGTAMLVSRALRPRLCWLVLGGAGVGLGGWALFHLATDGEFTRLLWLQLTRYAGQSGFEVMSGFAPFQQVRAQLGLATPLAWNLNEHTRSFLQPGPHGSFHLALLAAGGQLLLVRRSDAAAQGRRWLLLLWWSVPLAFNLLIWEPAWDHYFIQYLPPFAILAAACIERIWRVRRARLVAVVALLYAAALGPGHLRARTVDYTSLAAPGSPGERWLLFDPFLNFVSGTEPACGIIDPFNVYGERSLVGTSVDGFGARHRVSVSELIACLERDPSIRIGEGGAWGAWFFDGRLRAYLDRLPEERFFAVWPARPRFDR